EHDARLSRRLQRLRQDNVIERIVWVIGEIGIGVALHHRQPLGDAFVDALARQLDAAAVNAARLKKPQQFTVAAADVEHARAVLHHCGDQQQVDARTARTARGFGHGQIVFEPRQHRQPLPAGRPRALAAPSKKPRTMANNSGSSSKNASWPLSVVISANETRAPEALSACTMARDSAVGNSQSLVNEMTQNRVGVLRKALAAAPS